MNVIIITMIFLQELHYLNTISSTNTNPNTYNFYISSSRWRFAFSLTCKVCRQAFSQSL